MAKAKRKVEEFPLEDYRAADEREAVEAIAAAVRRWHAEAGPGLDVAFEGLRLMLMDMDAGATTMEQKGQTPEAINAWAVTKLHEHAAKLPQIPGLRAARARRLKTLGGADKWREEVGDYEARTLAMWTDDFGGYYEEVGLRGVMASLAEFVRLFGGMFNEILDMPELKGRDVYLYVAYQWRSRLDKQPEIDAAMKFLAAAQRKDEAAARRVAKKLGRAA